MAGLEDIPRTRGENESKPLEADELGRILLKNPGIPVVVCIGSLLYDIVDWVEYDYGKVILHVKP